jgi:hypothetical protein
MESGRTSLKGCINSTLGSARGKKPLIHFYPSFVTRGKLKVVSNDNGLSSKLKTTHPSLQTRGRMKNYINNP